MLSRNAVSFDGVASAVPDHPGRGGKYGHAPKCRPVKGDDGHQSRWFAFFGKPGRCARDAEPLPLGACSTTQRSGRITTWAPSLSRRATAAGMSSVSTQAASTLVLECLG